MTSTYLKKKQLTRKKFNFITKQIKHEKIMISNIYFNNLYMYKILFMLIYVK